jgi:hypothetical protein
VIITSNQWTKKELYGWKGLDLERLVDSENVQIKARRIWKSLVHEDSAMIVDSSNIESKVVKSLIMKRICDKLTKIDITYLTSTK